MSEDRRKSHPAAVPLLGIGAGLEGSPPPPRRHSVETLGDGVSTIVSYDQGIGH